MEVNHLYYLLYFNGSKRYKPGIQSKAFTTFSDFVYVVHLLNFQVFFQDVSVH